MTLATAVLVAGMAVTPIQEAYLQCVAEREVCKTVTCQRAYDRSPRAASDIRGFVKCHEACDTRYAICRSVVDDIARGG